MEQLRLFEIQQKWNSVPETEPWIYTTRVLKSVKRKRLQLPDKADCSETALDAMRQAIACSGHTDRENLVVLAVDAKNQIVGAEVTHTGTWRSSNMGITNILRFVISMGCEFCVIGHNHPSGNVKPSEHDIGSTAALSKAAEICGICLHDHIVFDQQAYGEAFSLRNNGLL